jgi:hypothetical protein
MTPHSPGPWQVEAPPLEAYSDPDIALSEEVRFWIVDEGRTSEVLAEVTVTMHGNEEANARVMAAAPDLLAALKAAVETIRVWESFGLADDKAAESWALYQDSPEMKLINAAIAKATGP